MSNILRLAQVNNFLSHVLGVVGNAFETLGDHHHMQAPRDGLSVGNHLSGQLPVDVLIQGIYLLVLGNQGPGSGRIVAVARIGDACR